MHDPEDSLHARALARIAENSWGPDAQQTFLKDIWPKLEHDYGEMVTKLQTRCQQLIDDKKIPGIVTGRVKSPDSIEKSLNRRSKHRQQTDQPQCKDFEEMLNEVHDLAGLRIVVDYPDHLEVASRLVAKAEIFHGEKNPIVFTADRQVGTLWQAWFGAYECVNHHVKARFFIDDPLRFYNNILFEIQVTSLPASLYNKIAHPLHYKGSAGDLSRRDEMVIDLTKGLALCYSLCLYYKADTLDNKDIGFMREHAEVSVGKELDSGIAGSTLSPPEVPELRNTNIKGIPAQILQQVLGNLSPRPNEAAKDAIWDSLICELSVALQQLKDVGNAGLNAVELQNQAISSLQFEQMGSREMSLEAAHEDTCSWLLEAIEYKTWLQPEVIYDTPPSTPFFWIKGKPGSGKSTVMKYLHAAKRDSAGDDTVLSFFFNARGNDLEKSTLGLYRSVLFQLYDLEPNLRDTIDALGPAYLRSIVESGWDQRTALKDTLKRSLASRKPNSRLYVFIDALDECPEQETRDMLEFFEFLVAKSRPGTVRFCFASRPYPSIGLRNCHELLLHNEPGHVEDIRSYIESRLTIFDVDTSEADELKHEIQQMSSGIFLWVVLVIPMLQKATDKGTGHSLDLLRREFAKIPKDLNELFQEILTKDGDISGSLLLTIQWILFAKNPLTPDEFYNAVHPSEGKIQESGQSVSHDILQKYILEVSKGLVEVTNSIWPTVQFIHESVKDFLLSDGKFHRIGLGDNFEGQSHHVLAQYCLSLIELSYLSREESFRLPLSSYANRNTLYHANIAQRHGIGQKALLERFPLRSWLGDREEDMPLLYLLPDEGMESLIEICPGRELHLTKKMEGGYFEYPVFAAIDRDYYNSMRALFGFELIDYEEQCHELRSKYRAQNAFSCCPILSFLRHGSYGLVRRILETNHYDPPCPSHGLREGGFLRYAVSEEQLDLWFKYSKSLDLFGCYQSLHESKSNQSQKLGSRVMCFASQQVELCRNLIRANIPGIDTLIETVTVDQVQSPRPKSLCFLGQFFKHSFGLLQSNPWGYDLLLQSKSAIPVETSQSVTLKHVQEAIVRCPELLHCRSGSGSRLIKCAFRHGFERLLELVISQIISSRDDLGSTSAAIVSVTSVEADFELRCNIIHRILDASFDLNGSILLHHACRKRHNGRMVKFLLHDFARFDINSKDDIGETALFKAVKSSMEGEHDSVDMLLEAGAALYNIDDKGSTILHAGAGHSGIVRLLLEEKRDIGIETRDRHNRTALHIAAQEGAYESVTLLTGISRPTVDSLLLDNLISSAEVDDDRSYEPTLQSCEVLRLLLNRMKENAEGTLPSRDLLPFDIAKKRGRIDMFMLMEKFLQGKDLSRPIDKLEALKLSWAGNSIRYSS